MPLVNTSGRVFFFDPDFAKPFLNFIDDTMIWYLNPKLDLNLSCTKGFLDLNSLVTWCINWRKLLALIIFQRSLLKWFPVIKRLAITLMYCNILHAWWSTQSRLATLLSSLIARRWVGLQTLWRFRLKDVSIDEMVGAWCFGCLPGPLGFTCWTSFAPVFSFIYCWVLVFALSPCYILIYMFFLSYVCYACARVCLYVPCGHLLGKGWPVVSNCEFVTFPLVFWVRCGT